MARNWNWPLLLGAGLLLAVVLAALSTLLVMRATDLRGDEYTYLATARGLAAHLGFGPPPPASLPATLLGTGWFMQGLGVIGTPLVVLTGEPALWQVRAWMLAFNLALLALLCRMVWHTFGRLHVAALLVFPALAAGWHMAASAMLPDVPAGLLAAIALVAGYRLATTILRGERPGWRDLLIFEAALLLAIHLRGPMLPLALALHVLLLVLALLHPAGKLAACARIGLGLAALALLIAPWSILASRHFGEVVVTTTNVPLVLADGFGDPALTCFGPCGEGYDIWPAWHYAQAEAAREGINPLAMQRQMMANSLSGLTLQSYLAQVRENFGRFAFNPAGWVRQFAPVMYGVPSAMRGTVMGAVSVLTLAIYVPFLFALMLANVLIFRSGTSLRVQAVLIKLGTACLFIQPFVHKSSGRYWTTFAPLMAWSAVLVWLAWRARGADTTGGPTLAAQWMDWGQIGWTLLIAVITAALLLA